MGTFNANAFQITGPTQKITTGVASAATALGVAGQYAYQVELNNQSAINIFVEFGGSGQAASLTASYPVFPGQCKTVSVPANTTHIATIAASGTPDLYVTPGRGL